MAPYPNWQPLTTSIEFRSRLSILDPDVFAVLLESVVNVGGFSGIESGLNLPLLIQTLVMAVDFDMKQEMASLSLSISRYICQKIMFHNPWAAGVATRLGQEYFKFRSAEIYQSWKLLDASPRLARHINIDTGDLIILYVHTVHHNYWPALTQNVRSSFKSAIENR
jgi:hypothetical protein